MKSTLDSTRSFERLWINWKILGVNPPESHKRLYYIYGFVVNSAVTILLPILLVINLFLINDLEIFVNASHSSISSCTSSLKHLILSCQLSKFRKIESFLRQLDQRVLLNANEVKLLQEVTRQCRVILKVFEIIMWLVLSSYIFKAFWRKELMFEGWVAVEWLENDKCFYAVLIWQIISSTFQLKQNTNNDGYPLVTLHILNGHIRALCVRIANVGRDPTMNPEENFEELRSCINDHKVIIRMFQTIADLISLTVFLQYTITAIVICMAFLNYAFFNTELSQLLFSSIYIFAIIGEIFPTCYFANALTSNTDQITNAIFSCNWMDQSIEFRKSVIIFMQRSQKNNVILAGGLKVVSLRTFLDIMRFTFSASTILRQLK